jgi:hypothetical protein
MSSAIGLYPCADALAWAGRLDRAHPTLNEAMDMAVEHFGVTHHLVASILLKKGTLTFQSGSVVDAMCYYEEAAEVYEELEYNDLGACLALRFGNRSGFGAGATGNGPWTRGARAHTFAA